jgi:hypothetical protein
MTPPTRSLFEFFHNRHWQDIFQECFRTRKQTKILCRRFRPGAALWQRRISAGRIYSVQLLEKVLPDESAAERPAAVTISRHSRPDPVFGLIEAHRNASVVHLASLREQERLEKADIWECDAAEQACHEEFRIFDALLAAGATTPPGLVAKLFYLQDIAHCDAWMLTDRLDAAILLLEGFAVSVANVMAVTS